MSTRLVIILPNQEALYLSTIDPVKFQTIHQAKEFKTISDAKSFVLDHIYDFVIFCELKGISMKDILIESSDKEITRQEIVV